MGESNWSCTASAFTEAQARERSVFSNLVLQKTFTMKVLPGTVGHQCTSVTKEQEGRSFLVVAWKAGQTHVLQGS